MTDALSKTFKVADHNRYTIGSILLAIVLIIALIAAVGCASKTTALIPSSDGEVKEVTRQELDRQIITVEKDLAVQRTELEAALAAHNEQVQAHNAAVDTAYADLDRQDEFKAKILATIGTVTANAGEYAANPIGLIGPALGLLGGFAAVGTAADNRRKDKVIANKKDSTTGLPPVAAPPMPQ